MWSTRRGSSTYGPQAPPRRVRPTNFEPSPGFAESVAVSFREPPVPPEEGRPMCWSHICSGREFATPHDLQTRLPRVAWSAIRPYRAL